MSLHPTGISVTLTGILLSASASMAAPIEHFHDKGKLPSTYTIAKQQQLRETLPFADQQDFEEQKRGFIAAPDYKQIMAEKGHVAWDMGKYDFLLQGQDFDSIHPSLQRQAILNMNYGLYEVIPGIYQIRGYDLANISFIKGDTGWIVFDPLTAKETAAAALTIRRPRTCSPMPSSSSATSRRAPARVTASWPRPWNCAPVSRSASPKTGGPDLVRAMTTDLFLDFLGIRMDSRTAEDMEFTINVVTPDNGEQFVLEMSNATLTNIKGQQANTPDLTITVARADLETVMMGAATFDEQIKNGKARLDGDTSVYDQLKTTLVQFELGFAMMPVTAKVETRPDMSTFQQAPPAYNGD